LQGVAGALPLEIAARQLAKLVVDQRQQIFHVADFRRSSTSGRVTSFLSGQGDWGHGRRKGVADPKGSEGRRSPQLHGWRELSG
jgi:hypothetical protein